MERVEDLNETSLKNDASIPQFICALFLPAGGWWLLWATSYILTFFLAPYNSTWNNYWGWPEGSPPEGSIQRTMDAFFDSPLGEVLPANIFVATSVVLYVLALARRRAGSGAIWTFALRQTLMIAGLSFGVFTLAMLVATRLELAKIPALQSPSYTRSFVVLAPSLVGLSILLGYQFRCISWGGERLTLVDSDLVD